MKHNLLKSVIISVILLMGVSNAWGASPIYSIGDVYVTGSMNGWKTNLSDWKLGSGNHCTKTFYLEESETNYTFKLYLKSGYYTVNGYWFTKTTSGPAYSLSTSGSDMQIETKNINAASGYVKLDFDFWGEYSGDSKLSVTQSAVAALSPSLSASKTALIAADKSTITASCSGGSGSYTYTYKVTCDKIDVTNSTLNATTGSSVTFTAPSSVTGKKTYTITVTAKDSHALLSGLATKTATKTITVEEAHNVTVSYKYGSTIIKANTTTSNVKYETASSITAPTITGYKFSSWTLGNGITNKSANTTTNPISITTKSSGTYTLTANYTEDLTSTWHIVGDPTSIFKGTSTWAAHNDNMLKKTTGASTASKGSLTIDVKTLPANNDSYQFKVLNTNGTKWYGWSNSENYGVNRTNNTTNVYNADNNNLYFIPDALGNYKFDVDWSSSNPSLKVTFPTAYAVTFGKGTGGSSVTAKYNSTSFNSGTKVQQGKTVTFTQSASTGYTFKEWNTKSDGTGTKLSAEATYTHTVVANNTVYAIYTKNPDNIVYLKPSHSWKSNNAQFAVKYGGTNHMMTEVEECCEEKYYKVTIPSQYSKFNFVRLSNNRTTEWNVTGEISVPTDGKNLYDMTKIYLKPNANWKSDGARFAAYFFVNGYTDSKKKWMSMLPTDEDGVFYCDFPTDHIFDRVSLTRMNGAESYNDWAYRLNQTKDIDLFQGYNSYELEEGKWGKDNSDPQKDDEMNVIYKCKWTTYNPTYSVTLEPSQYGYYTVEYNGKTYKSLESSNVVINDVPLGTVLNIGDATPHNSAYTHDLILQESTGGNIRQQVQNTQHVVCGHTVVDDNFVTKAAHKVYLAIPDDLVDEWNYAASTTGTTATYAYSYDNMSTGGTGVLTKMTEVDQTTEFCKNSNYTYYSCEVPAGHHTFRFERKKSNAQFSNCESITETFRHVLPMGNSNCYILTKIKGTNVDYKDTYTTFEGSWQTPPADGDYRLIYVEQVVQKSEDPGEEWQTIVKRTKCHPSDVVRKQSTNESEHIVSLHVYKKGSHPEVILQQFSCSEGKWIDIEAHMVNGPLETDPGMAMLPGRKNAGEGSSCDDFVYDDGIEIIKADTEKDGRVWNFTIQQFKSPTTNNDTATLILNDNNKLYPYNGQYYIRTLDALGGWNDYTIPANHMSHSAYAEENDYYSYYFCKYINEGTDVSFVVANDYGMALTDTLYIDRDFYGTKLTRPMVGADGKLPAQAANVRFSWNDETNITSRAYIAGSYSGQNEFLVVRKNGDDQKVTILNGNNGEPGYFNDNTNWLYYADVKAQPGAKVQVVAKYNGIYQYFMGEENQYEKLIGGTENTTNYPIRILYDFPDHRFVVTYVPPTNDITGDVAIETPVMLIRKNHEAPNQITFSDNSKTITAPLPAYGTITFTEDFLKAKSKSQYERMLYWVSFPFDVQIKDVFGLGEYGTNWIMEFYDGENRSIKGLDTYNTFWEYILDDEYILKAGLGYVLCLNADQVVSYFLDENNTKEELCLYFPSMETVTTEVIKKRDPKTIDLNVLDPRTNSVKSITDHNWHLIGVPSYVNTGETTQVSNSYFFYKYDATDNTYDPQSSFSYNFMALHSYMVQHGSTITWNNYIAPEAIAAKRDANSTNDSHLLRLELQQNGAYTDQTFVKLQEEDATVYFDMNKDLPKIINTGANVYSIISEEKIQLAGSVMPIEATIIPLGIKLDAAGEYTFAMPDGTDGIVAELIDYETNTTTNLLFSDYTVSLPKGTNETRFALSVRPDKTVTSMENITTPSDSEVRKFIIDGVLYMQKDGVLYDAQGHIVR